MRMLLIKERRFLFGEFAVSKSQYLYNNTCIFITSELIIGVADWKNIIFSPVKFNVHISLD